MLKHHSSSSLSSKTFLMIFLVAAAAANLAQARLLGSWNPFSALNNKTKTDTLPVLPGYWKNRTSHPNNTRPLLDWLTTTEAPLCTLREALSNNATIIRDAIFEWLNETVLTPLTCPAAEQGPACAYSDQPSNHNEPGVWICRTMFNPFTGVSRFTTHCANPFLTLASDTCGSCSGTYPKTCNTTCQIFVGRGDTTETGVIISYNYGYAPYFCVDPTVALTLMNDNVNVACAKP